MPSDASVPPRGVEGAEAAYKRMEPEANALTEGQFSALNVDVIAATSTILGVAGRILSFRERMARLPEFDMRHVDELEDRAKAAWYAMVTSLPEPEPRDFQAMFDECAALRELLLAWAVPLVHSGAFDRGTIGKIKQGSGNKDIPSDVVALVALYRSKWDQIKNICGVTEAQLDRGAAIAPVVFATISRRENKAASSQSDGAQRVRRFWTLADRSYAQCRHAIEFLQRDRGDASTIAPSLRRNAGVRGSAQQAPTKPPPPAENPAVSGESEPPIKNG